MLDSWSCQEHDKENDHEAAVARSHIQQNQNNTIIHLKLSLCLPDTRQYLLSFSLSIYFVILNVQSLVLKKMPKNRCC